MASEKEIQNVAAENILYSRKKNEYEKFKRFRIIFLPGSSIDELIYTTIH